MGVLETQASGSLSRHSPENGLPPRHTSVIRCKITDPETQCKFPKGERTIRYSLLPRTNPKQALGSETGLWCCKCMEVACNRSTYDVHSSCSSGITLPFSFHRITSRMQRCCPHTARMGEGNHKKKALHSVPLLSGRVILEKVAAPLEMLAPLCKFKDVAKRFLKACD